MVDAAELFISTAAVIITIISSIAALAYWLGRRFTEIDVRFKALEARVDGIERRLDRVESRLDRVEERLGRVESRLDAMEERFKLIDERFKAIDEKFKSIDSRFNELKAYVESRLERVIEATRSFNEFMLEYLYSQGILRDADVRLLRGEAQRLARLAMPNPLTKEEWEKILKYIERDDLTLEEALEFRELARKVTREYGQYTEAWKLHILATLMVAKALKKLREEEEKRRAQKQEQQCNP